MTMPQVTVLPVVSRLKRMVTMKTGASLRCRRDKGKHKRVQVSVIALYIVVVSSILTASECLLSEDGGSFDQGTVKTATETEGEERQAKSTKGTGLSYTTYSSVRGHSSETGDADWVVEEKQAADIYASPPLLGGLISNAGPNDYHDRLGTGLGDVDADFLKYLEKHGVKEVYSPLNKLHIGGQPELGDERGLIATRHVAQGETLMSIPFSAALVLDEERDAEPYYDAGHVMAITAKLLREVAKGNASRYWPYLATFPKWLPMPWAALPPARVAALVQYGPTVRRLHKLRKFYEEAYYASDPAAIAHASWREFCWGVAMTLSHLYSLEVPPRPPPPAWALYYLGICPSEESLEEEGSERRWTNMFLPIADLLNHDPQGNVDWYSAGLRYDRLDLIATRHLARGAPAVANYGDRTSETYFLYYAFAPSSNPADWSVVFYTLQEAVEWFLRHAYDTQGQELDRQEDMEAGGGREEGLLDVARGAVKKYLSEIHKSSPTETDGEPEEEGRVEGGVAATEGEGEGEGEGEEWVSDHDDTLGGGTPPDLISGHDDLQGNAFVVTSDGQPDGRLLAAFSALQAAIEERGLRGENAGEGGRGGAEGLGAEEAQEATLPGGQGGGGGAPKERRGGGDSTGAARFAWLAVAQRCLELLEGYPTTLEQDLEMLRTNTLSLVLCPHHRNGDEEGERHSATAGNGGVASSGSGGGSSSGGNSDGGGGGGGSGDSGGCRVEGTEEMDVAVRLAVQYRVTKKQTLLACARAATF